MEEELKPKILCDLIVPTFNKLDFTQKFVKSFLAHTTTPARVIFIDNGSGDGTREYLSSLQSTDTHQFTVVLNGQNKGFILAVNQGLQMSDAPYVGFANNDLIFTHGWLEEIILTFKEYPDVGLLNPNSNTLNARPDKGETVDAFAESLHKLHAKGSLVEMPFCIGFCMVARRALVDKIGGFSRDFAPMFFEDSDYSRRTRQAGFKMGLSRRSYVWHHEHASLGQLGKEKEAMFAKSRSTYLNKWGRTLRIAWTVGSIEELMKVLDKAIDLGRDGNYVWLWVKGLNKSREDIFKEAKIPEFADVKFLPLESNFSILWKALTKKKKYDLIISANKGLCGWLQLIGQPTAPALDPERIRALKFTDLQKP